MLHELLVPALVSTCIGSTGDGPRTSPPSPLMGSGTGPGAMHHHVGLALKAPTPQCGVWVWSTSKTPCTQHGVHFRLHGAAWLQILPSQLAWLVLHVIKSNDMPASAACWVLMPLRCSPASPGAPAATGLGWQGEKHAHVYAQGSRHIWHRRR